MRITRVFHRHPIDTFLPNSSHSIEVFSIGATARPPEQSASRGDSTSGIPSQTAWGDSSAASWSQIDRPELEHHEAVIFIRCAASVNDLTFSTSAIFLAFFDDLRFGVFAGTKCIQKGTIQSTGHVISIISSFFSYGICSGIDYSRVAFNFSDVSNLKSVNNINGVVRHVDCSFIIQPSQLPSHSAASAVDHQSCINCDTKLVDNIQTAKRKKSKPDASSKKQQRLQPSSTTPFDALSPASQRVRHKLTAYERKLLKAQNKRARATIDRMFVELDRIDSASEQEMAEVIAYAGRPDQQSILKGVVDASPAPAALTSYFKQQHQMAVRHMNGQSNSGNRWNLAVYRLAIAVYLKSPAAFRVIQESGFVFFPSERSLRDKIRQCRQEEGIQEASLRNQREIYRQFLLTDVLPVSKKYSPSSASTFESASISSSSSSATAASASVSTSSSSLPQGAPAAASTPSTTSAHSSTADSRLPATSNQSVPTAISATTLNDQSVIDLLTSEPVLASSSTWTKDSLPAIDRDLSCWADIFDEMHAEYTRATSASASASLATVAPSTVPEHVAALHVSASHTSPPSASSPSVVSPPAQVASESSSSVSRAAQPSTSASVSTSLLSDKLDAFFREHTSGELTFDMVKLRASVVFDSCGLRIRGLCASHSDLVEMHDVFQSMKNGFIEEACYALQFMWSSSTNGYRFLGPYFNFACDQNGESIHACVNAVIVALHKFDFQVDLCICDGASSNLNAIAIATGCNKQPLDDDFQRYLLPPFSINPATQGKLWWIIDPVHLLKNVRNWLINSKISGQGERRTLLVSMQPNGVIAHDHLVELLEVDPPLGGAVPPLHRLRRSDVFMSSSFDKMHVSPAKRLLNRAVATALFVWNRPVPVTVSLLTAAATGHRYQGLMGATIEYISTFSNLFNEFFLKPGLSIYTMNMPAWKHLNNAELYMRNWSRWIQQHAASQISAKLMDKVAAESFKSKSMIAWQSIRCLMLTCQGYRGYAREWLANHRGFAKLPMRSSQSPLESFFSQARRECGDNSAPVAANYAASVGRNNMKISRVVGSKFGNVGATTSAVRCGIADNLPADALYSSRKK